MAIIGISGKINSGKDTTGQIIKIILDNPHLNNEGILNFIDKEIYNNEESPYYSSWQIKKFADKLKDIVCLLLGCTREQLEDKEFKEKELGEEWWYYQDAEKKMFPVNETTQVLRAVTDLIKPTPRLLLQLLGTECGRQIIHPNIWVNALMSDYKPLISTQGILMRLGMSISQLEKVEKEVSIEYPNWIITDIRFMNEIEAVEKVNGVKIKVTRKSVEEANKSNIEHESETALDSYDDYDYNIDNDGDFNYLIDQVRRILQAEFPYKKFYDDKPIM